jgi:hypothetical protein
LATIDADAVADGRPSTSITTTSQANPEGVFSGSVVASVSTTTNANANLTLTGTINSTINQPFADAQGAQNIITSVQDDPYKSLSTASPAAPFATTSTSTPSRPPYIKIAA